MFKKKRTIAYPYKVWNSKMDAGSRDEQMAYFGGEVRIIEKYFKGKHKELKHKSLEDLIGDAQEIFDLKDAYEIDGAKKLLNRAKYMLHLIKTTGGRR